MPKLSIRYRWRLFDEVRQKYITTPYHCDEETIRVQYPKATPVEGTRQELMIPSDRGEAMQMVSTSCLSRGKQDTQS